MYHRVSTKSENVFSPTAFGMLLTINRQVPRYGAHRMVCPVAAKRVATLTELIVYTNSIVLKATGIKFSTLQFSTVLKLFFTLFNFLCAMFFGWPPPS